MNKAAVFSKGRRYRYTLTRSWAPERGRIAWIMLNPSTADAEVDDPTIRRCLRFTDSFGKGEMIVVNLFALRATHPQDLLDSVDLAKDDDNGYHVCLAVNQADTVVAAWGVLNPPFDRWAKVVLNLVKEDGIQLWCLGKTKGGFPRHPLYVSGTQELVKWP